MIVFLDGKGSEAALVDMAAAVVVLVVTADMSGEQPHHVFTQIAVAAWPEDEVEMVGHQAIGEQAHGDAFASLTQQFDEGGVIAVFVEDGTAAIAPIEDMVTVAALGTSWVAWHRSDYRVLGTRRQAKSTLSPFLASFSCPLFLLPTMMQYRSQTFRKLFDRDSGALFTDMVFENCTFDWCGLSLTKEVNLRSTVRNIRLASCSVNCLVGPAVFEDVTVDGLATSNLLILWCPLFKHVTLKGKIGNIKVNLHVDGMDHSLEMQRPFDLARTQFYETVDWALDISQAQFKEFDLQGVPARLIRRDPATQVVVTREKALRPGWREQLSSSNTLWPFVIDLFLQDGEPDRVLVAPKGKSKRRFTSILEGLNELRQVGVAEPD